MLYLINVEGKVEFECKVVGYQFPEDKHDDWCLVEISVAQGKKQLTRVDPALEATELKLLQEWFTCLSRKRLPRFAHLTFTEPCIGFEFLAYRNDVVRIAVHLSHELKPDFKLRQFGFKSKKWIIVFELDDREFESVLDGMANARRKYPIRGR